MPQNFVAIDISHSQVRAAVLEVSLRSAELTAVHTVARSAEDNDATCFASLRALLPPQLDFIVVGVGGKRCSTRLLEFPITDPRKVEAALDFELDGQIPYDLQAVAASWVAVRREATSTQVLAALTPKAPLVADLATLTAAGLEPRALVPVAAALSELVTQAGEDPLAVLSLGETESHLAIVQEGLRYLRTLRSGGQEIDRSLAQAYRLDVPTAKHAKETEGRILAPGEDADDAAKAVSTAIIQGLAPLVRELTATLRALSSSQRPARLLLTGGLSRLPGLAAYLALQLDVPVDLVDLRAGLGAIGCRLESLGPELAPVVGLALTSVRRGRNVPLNFRRNELAYRADLQIYRGQFLRLGIGIAALLVLGITGAIVRYAMLSSQERQVDRGFCSATQRIVGREICNPTAALATMRQAPGSTDGVAIPPYSAAMLFDMTSRAIDPGIDVTFDELEARVEGGGGESDRITARGEAAAFETTEQVVAALRRDPCVQDAEVSKQRKTKTGSRVEFSLTVKVSCPAGVLPGAKLQTAEVSPPQDSATLEEAP